MVASDRAIRARPCAPPTYTMQEKKGAVTICRFSRHPGGEKTERDVIRLRVEWAIGHGTGAVGQSWGIFFGRNFFGGKKCRFGKTTASWICKCFAKFFILETKVKIHVNFSELFVSKEKQAIPSPPPIVSV